MIYKVQSILKNWYKNDDSKNGRMMLVKYMCKYDFLEETNLQEVCKLDNSELYIYNLKEDIEDNPYEPFLPWIREKICENNIDINTLLDNEDVLFIHRQTIEAYLNGEEYLKEECAIDEENSIFMREKMCELIVILLKKLSLKYPVVFAFDRLHCAKKALIRIINAIFDDERKCNITIIAGYNYKYPVKKHVTDEWKKMINLVKARESIFESDDVSKEIENSIEWNPDLERTEEYLDTILRTYKFEEHADALYYIKLIYKKITTQKYKMSNDLEFKVLHCYTNCLIRNSMFTEATIISHQLQNCLNAEYTDYKQYLYYWNAAIISIHTSNFNITRDILSKTLESAQKTKDEKVIVRVRGLISLINSYDNYFDSSEAEPFDNRLSEKLGEYGFYYLQVFYLTFIEKNAHNIEIDIMKDDTSQSKLARAIKIATMLKDSLVLCRIYSMVTSKMASIEHFDASIAYAKKWIAQAAGIEIEKAYAILGMGYNYGIVEDYQHAHDCYMSAMDIFFKNRDVGHIAETLYNMSINAFMAEAYEKSIEFINIAENIMEKMGIYKLFACDRVRMYAIKAIASYRLGKMYICVNELKKIERNIDVEDIVYGTEENVFYYYLIKGIIEGYTNNNHKLAIQLFDKAEEYYSMSDDKKYFGYIQLNYERIGMLLHMGENIKASEYATEVIQYCDSKLYKNRKKFIMSALNSEESKKRGKRMKFARGKYNDDVIMNMVEYKMQSNNVQKYNIERTYLVEWQKIMTSAYENFDSLIEQAMASFREIYNMSVVLIIRLDRVSPVIRYVSADKSVINIDEEYIIDYFSDGKSSFATCVNDDTYDEYAEFFEAVKGPKLYSLFAIPFRSNCKLDYVVMGYELLHNQQENNTENNLMKFSTSDIEVYESMYAQLISAIERIEGSIKLEMINKYLHNAARTDSLTKLLNRKGMFENFEGYIKQIANDEKRYYTVIYIDLDNFKFYNDNFGHKIGDLILVEFSRVINIHSKKNGFAVRYGGDEFMVILEDFDNDRIQRFIDNVYENFKENNGYEELVSNELGRIVTIPDNKRLSCSIGIARCELTAQSDESAVDNAINYADKALYKVKNNGKGSYAFI